MAPSCKNCKATSKNANHPRGQQRKHQTSNQTCSSNEKETKQSTRRYFGCGICKKDHRLATCGKYVNMNLTQKHNTVERLHYCKNCLARNHLLTQCESKARCSICKCKHHTSLHGHNRLLKDTGTNHRSSSKPSKKSSAVTSSHSCASTSQSHTSCNILRTVIPTALIKIQLDEGTKYTRAVLNSSAKYTSIAFDFVKEFDLKTFKMEDVTYTKLSFKATIPPYPKFEVNALVTRDLPKTPYIAPFSESILEKFPRMDLADPQFISNSLIQVEIGANIHPTILKPTHMKAEGGLLMAMDSALGWLVIGSAIA